MTSDLMMREVEFFNSYTDIVGAQLTILFQYFTIFAPPFNNRCIFVNENNLLSHSRIPKVYMHDNVPLKNPLNYLTSFTLRESNKID